MFAALRLIELGMRPVIIERGKPVEERIADINIFEEKLQLNPESNYCYGEGGAGTFSDGKIYTRAKKRGDHQKILEILNYHGAEDNILYEAHPHIGSDRLPGIIAGIRTTILDAGGVFLFNTKVKDFIMTDGKIAGIRTQANKRIYCSALLLATGHSARDIYYLMLDRGFKLEPKPFAMGVRVEHPQHLINQIQYHGCQSAFLPAAAYNVVQQVGGRGVYSFCMCPGGKIVPASTSEKEIVLNGMSNARRNSPFANSGMVVQILPSDYHEYNKFEGLAALKLQEEFECKTFNAVRIPYLAPAQRIIDFVGNKTSSSLPENSYIPGVVSSDMHRWMPGFIVKSLQEAFLEIDKRMHGFISSDGIMLGVESRTSSPVRIPRDPVTGEHVQIRGLFPCGEGSGYSGGIISSAVDGQLAAEKCVKYLLNH